METLFTRIKSTINNFNTLSYVLSVKITLSNLNTSTLLTLTPNITSPNPVPTPFHVLVNRLPFTVRQSTSILTLSNVNVDSPGIDWDTANAKSDCEQK